MTASAPLSRHLSCLALTALLALLLVVAACKSVHAQNGIDWNRQQLIKAAMLAGTPLSASPRAAADDFNDQANRLAAIYQLRNTTISDPTLDVAWSDMEAKVYQCLQDLYSIAKTDSEQPSGLGIVIQALATDNNSQQQQAQLQSKEITWVANAIQMAYYRSQFRDDEQKLEDSFASFASVAARIAPASSGGLAIQYLPSWNGIYPGDYFELQNTTGAELDNAVVFVTVHDASGATHEHVHTISHLENGASVATSYALSSGSYLPGEAVETPASVDVLVLTPTQEYTASWTVTQQVWDSIVKNYCAPLQVSAHFLGSYTEDQTNQVYYPGVEFSFTGVNLLPVKDVYVYFWTGNSRPISVVWHIDPSEPYRSGQNYDFRTQLFQQGTNALAPGTSPQHIALVFDFPNTNYQQVVHVY